MKLPKKLLSLTVAAVITLTVGNSALGVSAFGQDTEIIETTVTMDSTASTANFEVSLDNVILDDETIAQLEIAYEEFLQYADELNVPVSITADDYINSYSPALYPDVNAYAEAFESMLSPMPPAGAATRSSSSSGSSAWYYNTGTTLPSNATPVYNSNLYASVQKGDIVYEANGGFGITGHAAIVEGKYYDVAKNVNYIRIIEAIDVGVVRSVLDDTRAAAKGASVYRVIGAGTAAQTNAINFCVGELGSTYSLDFAKDASGAETNWYCSELVWAAYYNQGFDIECSGLNEPGVTPRDITVYSSYVTLVYSA